MNIHVEVNRDLIFMNPASKIPKTCIKTSRSKDSHKKLLFNRTPTKD